MVTLGIISFRWRVTILIDWYLRSLSLSKFVVKLLFAGFSAILSIFWWTLLLFRWKVIVRLSGLKNSALSNRSVLVARLIFKIRGYDTNKTDVLMRSLSLPSFKNLYSLTVYRFNLLVVDSVGFSFFKCSW